MDAITPEAERSALGWTDQRVADLKRLWDVENWSATQIEAAFGHEFSRSAIIAKAHRLGLAKRERSPGNSERSRRRRRKPGDRIGGAMDGGLAFKIKRSIQATQNKQAALPLLAANPAPAASLRISIWELTETTCRWPIGHPGEPDFCFCGLEPVSGLPYCGYHSRIAYQPVERRRAE